MEDKNIEKTTRGNIFQNLTFAKEEVLSDIFDHSMFHVKQINSEGQTTDVFDQKEDEWVLLLQGEAKIEFLDETNTKVQIIEMKAGDWLFIPAHLKHRVYNAQTKNIWLCIYNKQKV